ncbi:hypothetical protein NKH77_15925 [Streptomyces sp. M19]
MLREAVYGATERTPGIGLVQKCPHVPTALRDKLGERRRDEVGACREVPMDRGDAQTGASRRAPALRAPARPLPYGPGLPERVRALGISRVDRALDVAGAGSLDELISLTNGPQSVVTLADFTGPSREVRLSLGQYGGQPDGRHGLAVAADLAEKGLFHVPVQAVFPASQAAEDTRRRGQAPPREDRHRSHGTHAWPLTPVSGVASHVIGVQRQTGRPARAP